MWPLLVKIATPANPSNNSADVPEPQTKDPQDCAKDHDHRRPQIHDQIGFCGGYVVGGAHEECSRADFSNSKRPR